MSGEHPWRPGRGARLLPWPLLIAAIVVVADQAAKRAVIAWLGPDQSRHRVELLGRALAFEYVENTGAAFGVLRGQTALLILLTLAVVAGLGWYARRATVPSRLMHLSLGLLLGGALGNLLDRVRLGHVVDYVAVGIWPKFNVADSAITVGALLLGWQLTSAEAAGDRSAAIGNRWFTGGQSDDERRRADARAAAREAES